MFTPAVNFEQNTRYEVSIKNITSSLGVSIPKDFSYSFKTISTPSVVTQKANLVETQVGENINIQSEREISYKAKPKITLLNIPVDLQDKKLSCEAASLKMALLSKDIYVTEDDIMNRVGYDLTPLRDGIWGDPNSAFVGDIDGKICVEGYGVHWGPIAKVANDWTDAEAFSLWDLNRLVKEIQAGNPVVVWGVVPDKVLRDFSWYTPDGDYIKTYKDTHVRLVVGFIGEASNPSTIILNDPTSGRLYWSADKFMNNWKAFGYSGVVVR